MTDYIFSFDEELDLLNKLAEHHSIFQTFWSVGKPIFSKSIPTAAVGFDKTGYVIYMIINPDFWDSLDLNNKAFVLAHECLHIILNHGKRGNEFKNQKLVNIAQDIVINEMLVNCFGFNKFEIKNWENFCFVETVFSNEEIVLNDIHNKGSFYYYLDLLMKEEDKNRDVETIDYHGAWDLSNEESEKNDIDSELESLIQEAQENSDKSAQAFKEEIDHTLSDKDKKELADEISVDFKDKGSMAGDTPLGQYININLFKKIKNRKWESIVKNHIKSLLKYETEEKESWISRGRRHACLDDTLMAQGMWSEEKAIPEKYNLYFFLDASGSCNAHAQRFVKMLQSIPEDTFSINAYSFDTRLYPIDIKSGRVQGCGGTRFTILDNKIKEVTQNERHPDAIFVLSDGDGDRFSPDKPKLWHWILTDRHSTYYIPKDSPKHKMRDFI